MKALFCINLLFIEIFVLFSSNALLAEINLLFQNPKKIMTTPSVGYVGGNGHQGIDWSDGHGTSIYSTNYGKKIESDYSNCEYQENACCAYNPKTKICYDKETGTACTYEICPRKTNKVKIEYLRENGKKYISWYLHLAPECISGENINCISYKTNCTNNDILSAYDYISNQQYIGRESNSGFTCSNNNGNYPGSHLHYQINDNNIAVNPENYFGNDEKSYSILIPLIDIKNGLPSYNKYSVFAYSSKPLTVTLNMPLEYQDDFESIGFEHSGGLDRNISNINSIFTNFVSLYNLNNNKYQYHTFSLPAGAYQFKAQVVNNKG